MSAWRPGTINAAYIEAIAIAERGAHPAALLDEYPFDAAHVAAYARAARTDAGFAAWIAEHVFAQDAAA
jgi:glutaconate CoA-transferase subunit A